MNVEPVTLYDAHSIETLPWPDTEDGRKTKTFLTPLIKEGVEKYVSNVKTKLCLLMVGQTLLPITINEEEYQNSYVVSNYYPIADMEERMSRTHRKWQQPFVWTAGKFLQWIKINRAVMVNNWLFSTNLYPNLTSSQIRAVAHFLRREFPDYAHIFRGVNTLQGDGLADCLKQENFHLIGVRQIFAYDPELKHTLSSKVHYHHRRDWRLLETHGYSVISKEEITSADFPRLIDLYHEVYVDKYTAFSPLYTSSFLQGAVESGVIELIGIKKEGKIDGIMGIRELNGMMTVPFFGYDTHLPQSMGIYRMLSVLIIKEAEKRGLILNDSSGSSTPKRFRGLKPHPEYVAIYDRHLPFNRRFFWTSAGVILNAIMGPLLKRRK